MTRDIFCLKHWRGFTAAITLSVVFIITGCHGLFAKPRQKPVQVIYRFDEHRWLELQGFNCEGALWFVDQKRGIRTEVHDWGYRIFTRPYIHPSERYIALPGWGMTGAMTVSKDYGRTWKTSSIKGEEDDGSNAPDYENIQSLTVVNDQGFLLTKQGRIYMSSLPFDDPRMEPGGPGIDFTYRSIKGQIVHDHIDAIIPGLGVDHSTWGLNYIDTRTLHRRMSQYFANFQNLPARIPEVKNYQGWTHMRCDLNAGL